MRVVLRCHALPCEARITDTCFPRDGRCLLRGHTDRWASTRTTGDDWDAWLVEGMYSRGQSDQPLCLLRQL